MDEQNNGNVAPVGGEISSPAPAADSQQPVLETPVAATPAAEPKAQPTTNPTASFAQSTVGTANTAAPTQTFATTPVTQPQYNTTAAVPAGKKGGAGKIIAIIVILVLLIGAGVGGFLFYRAHEADERVLADAMKDAIERDVMAASSTVTVDGEGMKLTLKIDSVSNAEAEASYIFDAKFEGDGEYPDMNAKLEAIEGKDAFYVRVADYGNLATAIGELADETGVEILLAASFNRIGTDWYEIPYSKLGKEYVKAIDCTRDVMKDLKGGKYTDELMNSYKANPFITVDGKPTKANGYKLYKLKIDEDKAESFSDKLEDLSLYEDFEKCVESASGYSMKSEGSSNIFSALLGDGANSADRTITSYDNDDDYGEVYVEEKKKSEDPVITLGIKPWTHELMYISVTGEESDVKYSFESNLSKTGSIDIPSNTKSVDDLVEELENLFNSGSSSSASQYYDLYCTKDENYSGYASEEECKEAVDELFGTGSGSSSGVESLIEGFSI